MKNKRGLLIVLSIVFLLVAVSFISAENINLRVTGTINNYSSDFYMKSNSNALGTLDAYDMPSPYDPGSDIPIFYSDVEGNTLVIDNSNESSRRVNLTYSLPAAQSGEMNFSWDSLVGTNYTGNFTFYGDDSTYSDAIETVDMRSNSYYIADLSADTTLYAIIIIGDYIAPVAAAPVDSGNTEGGSGGGGGGGTVPSKPKGGKLVIDNKVLDNFLVINTAKNREIVLSNEGNQTMNIIVKTKGQEGIISIDSGNLNFNLAPGESKTIKIRILAPEKPGVYTGKLVLNDQEVLITVNANTKELLFDAGIVIPNQYKSIGSGELLDSQITLIPMGEEPRVDVTLDYLIKDFDGRTFLSESETILVEGQKTFKKSFSTTGIPPGDYVLALELTYPNGVATSSSHFEIKSQGTDSNYLKTVFYFLTAGILVLIMGVIFVIIRYKNIRKSMGKKKI